MVNKMYIFWRIKHWLRYEPIIAFSKCMAWFFHKVTKLVDKLGYWLYEEKWDILKGDKGDR